MAVGRVKHISPCLVGLPVRSAFPFVGQPSPGFGPRLTNVGVDRATDWRRGFIRRCDAHH
jgi:hypothetical protein